MSPKKWTDTEGRLRESGSLAEADLTRDDLKPFSWFRDSGLLWLLNAILADHGVAVSLAFAHEDRRNKVNGVPVGWFVHPGEPIDIKFDDIDRDRIAAVREVLGGDVVDAIWQANDLPDDPER